MPEAILSKEVQSAPNRTGVNYLQLEHQPRAMVLGQTGKDEDGGSGATWPLPLRSKTRSRSASRSLRGWWIVSTTAAPSEVSPERMSTTCAAFVESSPAERGETAEERGLPRKVRPLSMRQVSHREAADSYQVGNRMGRQDPPCNVRKSDVCDLHE